MSRYVETVKVVAVCAIVGAIAGSTAGRMPTNEGKVIWEEDFSDSAASGWATNYSSPSDTKGDPTITIKDGNLVFSSDFPEPIDLRGYAALHCEFAVGDSPGFLIAEAPVLEMRVRPLQDWGVHKNEMSITSLVNYESFGGKTSPFYVHLRTPIPPGQWQTVTTNLYDDEAATGLAGKKFIKTITFFLQSGLPKGESVALEIDWMRLRQMTANEFANVGVYSQVISRFQMQPCPKVEAFFGLGFYGLDPGKWNGGKLVAMDHMARHWVNFVGPAAGRYYQNVWRSYRSDTGSKEAIEPSEENRATYFAKTHQYLAKEFGDYGLYYIANMSGFAGGVDEIGLEDRELKQLESWADELTNELHGKRNILAWYCADEAGLAYLKSYLVTKALFESRDRSRPAMLLVNSIDYVREYDPSHQIIFTDKYPTLRPSRDNPWKIIDWMRDISRDTGDKPHWFTLQSFRIRQEPWYARPHPVEQTLMSWLAMAGGANVNCYFIYSSGPWWYQPYIRNDFKSEPFWACVDTYGNETPLFESFKEFAAMVGPIGDLLAKARLILEPDVKVIAPKIKLNGIGKEATRTVDAIYIGVLEPAQVDAQLWIAVNMDRDHPQPVKLAVDASADKRLYDLLRGQEISPASPGRYSLGTFGAGQGYPYIYCRSSEFEKAKAIVTATRARQALRVAKLDWRMANAWRIGEDKWKISLATAEQSSHLGKGQQALDAAVALSQEINAKLNASNTYRQCKANLDACRTKLGQISVMLSIAAHGKNPHDSPSLRALAKEIVSVSEEYDMSKRRFYLGNHHGLLDKTQKLRERIDPLVKKTSGETNVEVGYWPFPEKPWRQ